MNILQRMLYWCTKNDFVWAKTFNFILLLLILMLNYFPSVLSFFFVLLQLYRSSWFLIAVAIIFLLLFSIAFKSCKCDKYYCYYSWKSARKKKQYKKIKQRYIQQQLLLSHNLKIYNYKGSDREKWIIWWRILIVPRLYSP